MKQILWTSVLSLMVAACLTACGDSSSSSSYDIPSYKSAKDLPDSCAMEVAQVDTAYYACFENKWVPVTDSATIKQLKDDLDEKEIKKMLEELEDLQANSSSSTKKKKKSTSSSSGTKKTDGSSASGSNGGSDDDEGIDDEDACEDCNFDDDDDYDDGSGDGDEDMSSSSEEEEVIDCTGKTAKAADKQIMSVTVDGKKRSFIMHVPSAYKGDKAVPLVVDYHPIGGSGEKQMGDTKYKSQTDPEGVITLYPDGTNKPGGMGPGWNVGPCCSNDDDVKFTREMINMVEEIACIDPKRVYATGFHIGGGMAHHVACFMADVFAAVAPAAMDLNKTNSAKCNPARPISIIMFRGKKDNVCKYIGGDSEFNDGLNFLGAEDNFRFWAEKNGCTGSPTTNSDGCMEYSKCKGGTKVVLCAKEDGGTEQGDAKIGWPFLKQFKLP